MLRFVLRVEMVQVAKELVETVDSRQELIAVAKVVLAELPGHIAEWLEQLGKRRILFRQPFLRPRQAQPSVGRCASGSDQ